MALARHIATKLGAAVKIGKRAFTTSATCRWRGLCPDRRRHGRKHAVARYRGRHQRLPRKAQTRLAAMTPPQPATTTDPDRRRDRRCGRADRRHPARHHGPRRRAEDLTLLRGLPPPARRPRTPLAVAIADHLANRATPPSPSSPAKPRPRQRPAVYRSQAATGPRTLLPSDHHAGLPPACARAGSCSSRPTAPPCGPCRRKQRRHAGAGRHAGAPWRQLQRHREDEPLVSRGRHQGRLGTQRPRHRRLLHDPGPIATAISLPDPLPGNRAIQIELWAWPPRRPRPAENPQLARRPVGLADPPALQARAACGGLALSAGRSALMHRHR